MLGIPHEAPEMHYVDSVEAYKRMQERVRCLKSNDKPSFMITMPSDAAENALFYESLVTSGTAEIGKCAYKINPRKTHRS